MSYFPVLTLPGLPLDRKTKQKISRERKMNYRELSARYSQLLYYCTGL